MIRIRPYKDADMASVFSWCRDEDTFYRWSAGVLGEYPLTEEGFRRTGDLMRFTALDEKEPVGFFCLRNPKDTLDELRFGFVIVDPARRNRGIGRAMLRLGLDYAFGIYRADRVTLAVFEDNLPARACYRSAGFHETGGRETYPIGGEVRTAVEMECLRKDRRFPGYDAALTLHEPKPEELWFREAMLADEETMAYNHAWGGTIPFPKDRWHDWYEHWIARPDGRRFYRYLKDADGNFVGEIAYHEEEDSHRFLADVIVFAKFRGRGYGSLALDLLCAAANENVVAVLDDDMAADNPARGLFLRRGFEEEFRTDDTVMLKKVLL